MTDKVILVKYPDDILDNGIRILLVDLTEEQTAIVSRALTELETIPLIIVYSWKIGDQINWLFDKTYKSQLTIFNAESDDTTLVGYYAGRPNSSYFGDIGQLKLVNRSAIFDVVQTKEILKNTFKKYE
jgi:hypothetical protein